MICTSPKQFDYKDMEIPVAGNGETLLKIERIGICGTDLHAYEGNQPFFSYPRILGHELAATIVDTSAAGFAIGEPVTLIPYFNCGTCIACRMGKPNCCTNLKVCGVHIDGGMREYLSVPSYSLVHGEGLNVEELALIEPFAIGAHGITRAGVLQGEYVVVVGAGPIGLGVMNFARIAGGNVIAIDTNQKRLEFAKENSGVAYTVNPTIENVINKLKTIMGGDMPTVVIDATGNLNAINTAFQYLAHGGRYVLVGLQKEDIRFSHPEFHKREATLMSSRNATRKDFEYVINCFKKGLINPLSYLTHRVAFKDIKNKFESLIDPLNSVVKAMVEI